MEVQSVQERRPDSEGVCGFVVSLLASVSGHLPLRVHIHDDADARGGTHIGTTGRVSGGSIGAAASVRGSRQHPVDCDGRPRQSHRTAAVQLFGSNRRANALVGR